MSTKENKRNLILFIGALCLCTLVLCGFVLVPIITSEIDYHGKEQEETRKTVERVLDKRLSRMGLPTNFTINFRKTRGLWISNVDATDRDIALLAEKEDVEKLKVISAMTARGIESIEKEPIWDLEIRKHKFDQASFEAISRMKKLKRLIINKGDGLEESIDYLTGPAGLYHLELQYTKLTDRCLEHFLSLYPDLREFEVSNNREKFSSGLKPLAKLSKLRCIVFTNEHLKGEPIKIICNTTNPLDAASFQNCGIADDDTMFIRKLSCKRLNLAENMITDKGLLNLVGMKGLRELKIESCRKITEPGIVEFVRKMPSVRLVHKVADKEPSRVQTLLKEFFDN